MGFHFAYATSAGLIDSGTITALHPHPITVSYPDTFEKTSLRSKDGNAIVQRGSTDTRIRKWIWPGMTLTVPRYARLFEQLLTLQVSLREQVTPPTSPWVFLKEDVTGNLNKLILSGQTWTEQPDFIRVKVVSVTEKLASKGGNIKYDSVEIAFYIDDDTWNRF